MWGGRAFWLSFLRIDLVSKGADLTDLMMIAVVVDLPIGTSTMSPARNFSVEL